LTLVEFGNNFNQPIQLNKKLLKINFGNSFNQDLNISMFNRIIIGILNDDMITKFDNLLKINNIKYSIKSYYDKNINTLTMYDFNIGI